MGANWRWMSLRLVGVILPSAHQVLNWSASRGFLVILGSIREL